MESYAQEKKKKDAEKLIELLDIMPEFYKTYMYNIPENDLMYSSRVAYTRNVKEFFLYLIENHPDFKDKTIKSISLHDLSVLSIADANEYTVFLNNYSVAAISRKLAAVSALYEELIRLEKIKENPFAHIRRPKVKDHVIISLTEDERKRLMDVIITGEGLSKRELDFHNPLRDTALFSLFLDTGMRISEVVGINISDVDLKEHSIIITRKGGKTQEVFFSDETGEILEEYLQERLLDTRGIFSSALFLSRDHERLSPRGIEYRLKKYVRIACPLKADKISVHKLRSTFAMRFYEATGDLELTRQILGHSSITTTSLYAKATKERQKAARNILQNLTYSK